MVVYNRTKKKTREFKALGATVAGTPMELASLTDVVIVLIWDVSALEQMTLGPDGLLEGARRGHVFIDMSTQLYVSFHVRTMVKDTGHIKDLAEELGMPVPLSSLVHEMYKIGVNKGFGEENASAIVKVIEDMSGTVIKK